MFKFLKSIFRRGGDNTARTPAIVTPLPGAASKAPEAAPGVEVASLSLRAILEKLPSDLKAGVNQMPDDGVKVVLPVNTILKQLPSGCVKMSLASLYRQAPTGTFRKTGVEEKRMVDVPLAEVFKTINVGRLQRRAQRDYVVPDEIQGLFGENGRSHSVAPVEPAHSETRIPLSEPPKVLKMPAISSETQADVSKTSPAPSKTQGASAVAAPLKLDGELALSLVEIAAGWADGIRSELSVLTGDTKVVIPVAEVSTGLQKGKVAFAWSQLKKWLTPPGPASISIPDETVLVLPLKVVAPAFIAASGATKRTSAASTVGEKLPDFFGPTAGRVPESAPAPVAPPAPPAPMPDPQTPANVQTAEAPAPATAEAQLTKPVSLVAEPVMSPETARYTVGSPQPATPPVVEPSTLAELFNKPDQTSWSPNEIVRSAVELPGVLGTVIALEEGLVVAHKLPEGLSADAFAAFMPQIFSRIDKYTGEMQLGETNEVSVSTAGGPCQLFRRGKVFVAFLGRKDHKLPAGLHLVATEISNQNS